MYGKGIERATERKFRSMQKLNFEVPEFTPITKEDLKRYKAEFKQMLDKFKNERITF